MLDLSQSECFFQKLCLDQKAASVSSQLIQQPDGLVVK